MGVPDDHNDVLALGGKIWEYWHNDVHTFAQTFSHNRYETVVYFWNDVEWVGTFRLSQDACGLIHDSMESFGSLHVISPYEARWVSHDGFTTTWYWSGLTTQYARSADTNEIGTTGHPENVKDGTAIPESFFQDPQPTSTMGDDEDATDVATTTNEQVSGKNLMVSQVTNHKRFANYSKGGCK